MGKKKGSKGVPKKVGRADDEDHHAPDQDLVGSAAPEDLEKKRPAEVSPEEVISDPAAATLEAAKEAVAAAAATPPAPVVTATAEENDAQAEEETVVLEPTPVTSEEPKSAPEEEETVVLDPTPVTNDATTAAPEVGDEEEEEEEEEVAKEEVVVEVPTPAAQKDESGPEVVSTEEQPEVITSSTGAAAAVEVEQNAASSAPSENPAAASQVEAAPEQQQEVAAEVEEKEEAPAPSAAPIEPIDVGEEVESTWGSGIVKEIREDGFYVVQAERWRLAMGQTPTFYLQRKDLQKITPYVIWQWKTSKKLGRAFFLKEKGNELYKANDLEGAERKYSEAVGVLQLTVDDNMNNLEKAQKLEILIPVLNNAAVVRLRLQKHNDALIAAKSVCALIMELNRMKDGQVMMQLRELGVTDEQIFVKYMKKAAFVAGKVLNLAQEYDEAIGFFEKVKSLIQAEGDVGFKTSDAKEVVRLLKSARELKKQQDKAEKEKWSKTFAKFSAEEVTEEKVVSSAPASNGVNKSAPSGTTANSSNPKPLLKSRALSKPSADEDKAAAGGAVNTEAWLPAVAVGLLGLGLGLVYYFGGQKGKGSRA